MPENTPDNSALINNPFDKKSPKEGADFIREENKESAVPSADKNSNLINMEKANFIIDNNALETGPGNVSLEVKREGARSKIAFLYVSSFMGIIAVVFVYAMLNKLETNNIKDLLVTLSGILSGPLGFIIGFYFKGEENDGK